MSNVTDFDALFNAASTALEPSTSSTYPKLDCAGVWTVKAIEASYGKNQKGDATRTMIKVEVIANKSGSPDKVTDRTNVYLTVGKYQEMTNRNFAPYIKTLLDLGVSAEKIKDDAADYYDIAQNIATIITKQIKLGKEIKFDLQLRPVNGKENEFYKNIFVHTPAVEEAKTDLVVSDDPF